MVHVRAPQQPKNFCIIRLGSVYLARGGGWCILSRVAVLQKIVDMHTTCSTHALSSLCSVAGSRKWFHHVASQLCPLFTVAMTLPHRVTLEIGREWMRATLRLNIRLNIEDQSSYIWWWISKKKKNNNNNLPLTITIDFTKSFVEKSQRVRLRWNFD